MAEDLSVHKEKQNFVGGATDGNSYSPQSREKLRKAREDLRNLYCLGAEEAIRAQRELMQGIWVETTDAEGTKRIYQEKPYPSTVEYWIDRIMGKPGVEMDEEEVELKKALMKQQIAAGYFQAQASFLQAQAEQRRIENEMYAKQFVSEEDQTMRINNLLAAFNKHLLALTPELAIQFGMNTEQLQAFKAYMGRSHSEIIGEVMADEKPDEVDDEELGDVGGDE